MNSVFRSAPIWKVRRSSVAWGMVELKASDVHKSIFRAKLTLTSLYGRNLPIRNNCTNCWELQLITGRAFLPHKLSLEWKRKELLSKSAFTEEILSAECLYVRKSFLNLCNKVCIYIYIYIYLLITKIIPRGPKSSITLQPSFKEFLTSVHRWIMGSSYYRDYFLYFSCWKRKVCKTDYDIIHIYVYLHFNDG